ncbi:LytR/AlgR family response regulator transcription factor [Autumnicola edwardsiae]|uniref:LytTR family DNA-binding domain-containing protein n=1 Tax=Autumnicola edwardsiae TaxID=3075594 RepID=A0ABU3CSW3_9FLAO|nr:LytTR family DNA-binding domain-containing protein [Zunongwangia sp. F297]MDT0649317.1 LytTR family DNA-binding domain-containing protein [Zunongwangia sp. F297]
MNCVIVDDEELPRKILIELIRQRDDLVLLKEFNSSVEALKYLNTQKKTDLIFLDIVMPGFDGFDFIRALNYNPQIILISSSKSFALNVFEFDNITDYLLKPIKKDKFARAITKASNKEKGTKAEVEESKEDVLSREDSVLYINIEKRLIKIDIPSIKMIEAKGNFIFIKTLNENYITYSTLKKIEEKLPASKFLRVHRSFIINLEMIVDIQDNSVLIGKEVIPISRRNKPQLMKRLNLL